MGRTNYTKNLSILELSNIENYLNFNKGPSEIADILDRNESTIRKEIKNFSVFEGNYRKCKNCDNFSICRQNFLCTDIVNERYCNSCKSCKFAIEHCPDYHTTINCEFLKQNHHVCNACEFRKKCKKVKRKYIASKASEMHILAKDFSKKDKKILYFSEDFKQYLSNCIKNGISPEVILNTLPPKFIQYSISVPTLYEYINAGLLDCCNLDLRNKVKRKQYGSGTRRNNTIRTHHLNGRSIENLSLEERTNASLGIAEIDTVEGIKGGDLLFTIMFPCFSLMLAFKISSKTQEEIVDKLNYLERVLETDFYTLFKKTITDNGSEFLDFEGLEKSIDGFSKRLSIYYTHYYSSYKKPHVENNHRLIRWLIQKGYDISLLSSDDILHILNRVNNYPRKKLDFKTPLQKLEETMGTTLLKKLNLYHIPINELNMINKKM